MNKDHRGHHENRYSGNKNNQGIGKYVATVMVII